MKKKSCFPILLALLLSILTLTACGSNETVVDVWIEGEEETSQNKLAENVILVDELPLTLESFGAAVYKYSYNGTPPKINPGNILLSGKGEGYLLKVVSVQDLGGTLEVTVEQAALNEAFEELHIQETISIEGEPSQLKAGNVRQQRLVGKNESVSINIPGISFTDSSNYDVSVEGNFSFAPLVNIVIDISGKELITFKAELSGTADLDLDTIFEAATAVNVSPPELTLIGKGGVISPSHMQLFIVTITIPVGEHNIPVPVVSRFTLSAGVTFSAEDQVTAEFGFNSNCSTSLGLEYQDGWNPIDHSDTLEYSFDPYMNIDHPVALSVEAYVLPKVDTYLYGMLTPYFDHRISGRGRAVIEPEPKLEAEFCVAGSVGAEVRKISMRIEDAYFEIFDLCNSAWSQPIPACNDGIDNDSNGLIDWPDDPGCSSINDISESGWVITACNDEIDNDGDGLIDWPDDPDCSCTLDDSEGDITAVTIATGWLYTCALTSAGGVKCWGDNYYGQLGDGTTTDRYTPVDVVGLGSGVAAIAAGEGHTCAVTTAGGMKCWGRNSEGRLGDDTMIDRYTPVDVVGLTSGVKAIAIGIWQTCVLTSNGGVKCWGLHNHSYELTPIDVLGLTSGVEAITRRGYVHTCALTYTGGVKCWGYNTFGQLGDGTRMESYTPVDVLGLTSGVDAIDAGCGHTCAITSTAGIKCWGNNWKGQLGNDNTYCQICNIEQYEYPCCITPVDVMGLASDIVAVATGGWHTCALTSTGGMKCWGENHSGELGDGTTTDRYIPMDVVGLTSGVSEIAAGHGHTCALTSTGGVKCWGINGSGQLGNGSSGFWAYSTIPVDVVGFE